MRPTSFRYGGLTWEIQWQDEENFDRDYRGRTFIDRHELHVNARLPDDAQTITLLHELIHTSDMVFDTDSGLSEQQVRIVAHTMFEILKDNPEVRRFIFDG